MTISFGGQSMVAPLRRVVVKRPEEAFQNSDAIAGEWKELGYSRPPDFGRACRQHRQFVSQLAATGAEVLYLPSDERTGLDSLYAHDPVLITDAGVVVLPMGKPGRRGEGPALADALKSWGIPILGVVEGGATAEAGDLLWLDERTLLAGRGFRTNQAGVEALQALLRPLGTTVIPAPLPYGNGPRDVLHLMSLLSLLDADLAVACHSSLPVPLCELLEERGVQVVDVAAEEYETLGCNVLALSPRNVLMACGNPVTRARLQTAGCRVAEFDGSEICIPGQGGPTCLTRPLLRA